MIPSRSAMWRRPPLRGFPIRRPFQAAQRALPAARARPRPRALSDFSRRPCATPSISVQADLPDADLPDAGSACAARANSACRRSIAAASPATRFSRRRSTGFSTLAAAIDMPEAAAAALARRFRRRRPRCATRWSAPCSTSRFRSKRLPSTPSSPLRCRCISPGSRRASTPHRSCRSATAPAPSAAARRRPPWSSAGSARTARAIAAAACAGRCGTTSASNARLCGSTKGISYQEIDGGPGTVKAETCTSCRGYVKILQQHKDPAVDIVADDVASLGLDLLMRDTEFRRGGVEPVPARLLRRAVQDRAATLRTPPLGRSRCCGPRRRNRRSTASAAPPVVGAIRARARRRAARAAAAVPDAEIVAAIGAGAARSRRRAEPPARLQPHRHGAAHQSRPRLACRGGGRRRRSPRCAARSRSNSISRPGAAASATIMSAACSAS